MQFRKRQLPEKKNLSRQVGARELGDQTLPERVKDDSDVGYLEQRPLKPKRASLDYHSCISLEYFVGRMITMVCEVLDVYNHYVCDILSSRLVFWHRCNSVPASDRVKRAPKYRSEIMGNYLALLSVLERAKCAQDLGAQDFANREMRLNRSAEGIRRACGDLAERLGKAIDYLKENILRRDRFVIDRSNRDRFNRDRSNRDKLKLVVLAALRSYDESRIYDRYLTRDDEPCQKDEFSFFILAELEKYRSWLFGERETRDEQEQVQFLRIYGEDIAYCTAFFEIDGETIGLHWEFSRV